MAPKAFVNLADYLTPKSYPYEVRDFGTFELRDLTHGEVRALQTEYQTDTGIPRFAELLDKLVEMASVTPKFTPDAIQRFTGGEDVLRTLGQHIGHKCGWLTNPPAQDQPATVDPTPASSPLPNAS